MGAILGGAGAALAWSVATLCAARVTRATSPPVALAWVMSTSLLWLLPVLAFSRTPHIDTEAGTWLVLSGLANVGGLLALYRALGTGRIGIVGPIVAAEGGVAAVFAMLGGQGVDAAKVVCLAVVVGGVVLVARERDENPTAGRLSSATWAVFAATIFGFGLYATARAGADVPTAWAVLPPRAIGVVVVTLPVVLSGRIAIPRELVPIAFLDGLGEILGFLSFAAGSRSQIAIAAVFASLGGAVTALLGRLIHHERLGRIQIVGIGVLTAGVAVLSALQA